MQTRKFFTVTMALIIMMTTVLAACSSGGSGSSTNTPPASSNNSSSNNSNTNPGTSTPESAAPVKISMYYADNATLPFKEDWLLIQEFEKQFNVDLEIEPIPIADYATKVSLALNTGTNVPDVILYQSTTGENASLALNGAIVPISDYSDWTPNFNARVKEFGLEKQVADLALKDGKRYYLPRLFDKPFYDGGLIMREDIIEKYGVGAPKTFDDLYAILKKYKEEKERGDKKTFDFLVKNCNRLLFIGLLIEYFYKCYIRSIFVYL